MQLACHFRAVRGADLLHDIMYMRLDRAFTHTEFKSNDLVRLANTNGVDDFDFPRREQFTQNIIIDIRRCTLKTIEAGTYMPPAVAR